MALACVSRGTHHQVLAEREELRFENQTLRTRVQRLETSNEVLASERVALLEQIEDLGATRSQLERDVQALGRTRAQLEETLRARQQELDAREQALAARVRELEELRASYEGLVSELQEEVEAGRVQIQRLREGMRLELPSEVLFPAGSSELSPGGGEVLRKLAGRLARVPEPIEVHGHTDSLPIQSPRYPTNWELAGARAARVVRLLVEAGIAPERVVAVSHAHFDPVAPNDTAANRARNRRIEIRLVPKEGAPPR